HILAINFHGMKNSEQSNYSHIPSPAKINLFLAVTGKRHDGYHTLCTLMCCISLYDKISLNFNVEKISVSCSHENVPEDETNLACRAATIFFKKLGKQEGVGISIEKNIPVGGGLGGGSSNAASVLLSLNQRYGMPFSEKELMDMGLSLGADVPFFIVGKPSIATGIGEKLEKYDHLEPQHILLINPRINISTAEVYKNLNLRLTKCEKKIKCTLFNKILFNAEEHLCNDLETVTVSMHPFINKAKKSLIDLGAEGSLMSGSGPTVFGLFSDSDKAEKAHSFLSHNSNDQIFIADIIT
ncbi:MAG: 4-(cytidine 5'-diphospho)-2-C-methyl-D-erythritol kinase, partial [Desulfobacterales bacterium]|nr:4-(cytidine 5'-diphospho)-2-C-methyl-D-erythritol kinase [Desulfobacterales bacterium]